LPNDALHCVAQVHPAHRADDNVPLLDGFSQGIAISGVAINNLNAVALEIAQALGAPLEKSHFHFAFFQQARSDRPGRTPVGA
jgi:hypothetical protein